MQCYFVRTLPQETCTGLCTGFGGAASVDTGPQSFSCCCCSSLAGLHFLHSTPALQSQQRGPSVSDTRCPPRCVHRFTCQLNGGLNLANSDLTGALFVPCNPTGLAPATTRHAQMTPCAICCLLVVSLKALSDGEQEDRSRGSHRCPETPDTTKRQSRVRVCSLFTCSGLFARTKSIIRLALLLPDRLIACGWGCVDHL